MRKVLAPQCNRSNELIAKLAWSRRQNVNQSRPRAPTSSKGEQVHFNFTYPQTLLQVEPKSRSSLSSCSVVAFLLMPAWWRWRPSFKQADPLPSSTHKYPHRSIPPLTRSHGRPHRWSYETSKQQPAPPATQAHSHLPGDTIGSHHSLLAQANTDAKGWFNASKCTPMQMCDQHFKSTRNQNSTKGPLRLRQYHSEQAFQFPPKWWKSHNEAKVIKNIQLPFFFGTKRSYNFKNGLRREKSCEKM